MTIFHPRTRTLLAQAGLAPKELEALDHPYRHQVPDAPGGFGLIGDPGTGKSWVLARMFGLRMERWVDSQPDPARARMLWVDGEVARDGRLLWMIWLEAAREIRARRNEKCWVWDLADTMQRMPFLVLDDIGREERDQREDLAQEVFQSVIEYRYRHKLPLWWTCNRKREELSAFYGGPLASRILGTWPDFEAGGQDMRLFPVDEFKRAAGEDQ